MKKLIDEKFYSYKWTCIATYKEIFKSWESSMMTACNFMVIEIEFLIDHLFCILLGGYKVGYKMVLLNGLSISAKGELQSLCCMMGKTMSLWCHFLAANGWRLIDWIQNKIKLST